MARHYILLYNSACWAVYFGVNKSGEPSLFGGGTETKDKSGYFATLSREVQEESGYRFKLNNQGKVHHFHDAEGGNGETLHFYWTEDFSDGFSGPSKSKETCMCMGTSSACLKSIYYASNGKLAAFKTQFIAEMSKQFKQYADSGSAYYPTVFLSTIKDATLPKTISGASFLKESWHTGGAIYEFCKSVLPEFTAEI